MSAGMDRIAPTATSFEFGDVDATSTTALFLLVDLLTAPESKCVESFPEMQSHATVTRARCATTSSSFWFDFCFLTEAQYHDQDDGHDEAPDTTFTTLG